MDPSGCLYQLVALISAILITTPTTMGITEEAEYCDKTIRSGFAEVLKFIQNKPELSPLVFVSAPPCTKCQFYGINGMLIHGPCPSKKNGACDSIDHDFTLRFPTVKLVCECSLHTNPMEMLKMAQNSTQQKMPCNVTAEKLKDYQVKADVKPETLKIDELLKCEDCASLIPMKIPTASKIPTSFGAATSTLKDNAKSPPEKVNGTIITEWNNVDLNIGFRLNVSTNEMKPYKGQIGDSDPFGIVVTCLGSEKIDGVDPFQGPCKCLKKANHMKEVLIKFMDLVFPCYCNIGADQIKDPEEKIKGMKELAKNVFNEMSCKEFYNC